jgi:hypothetical protein
MFEAIERPLFRPAINVGGMLDIPTGYYELGEHGESILNGGASAITGIASRPNNFKSALAVYIVAMIRRACRNSYGLIYDTEGTFNPQVRFQQISRLDNYLSAIDYDHDPQFSFTDLSRYTGDKFFTAFRTAVSVKPKDHKKYMKTTPFLDIAGKPKPALYPTSGMIDSFSKFQISEVMATYEKNDIGHSKNNTTDMSTGKAKNQMFNQLPQLCAQTGTYLVMTAHVGDVIQMEMYPTDKRNLSGMQKDTIIKGGSGGFYSLPNNVWEIRSNKPLVNKEKMPIYPWDNKTAIEGDTNMTVIEVRNQRGKGGISNLPIYLIMTQTEGYQPTLSELHNCRENEWGLGGNLSGNFYLELRPDVSLHRTTAWQKLTNDPRLARAAEFSSEMLQMIQFHRKLDRSLMCTPKELYEDLKAMGYDWDVLLNTRGYWVFKEEEKDHEKPFLSTMDLLRMRQSLYKPYWMSKEDKAKITPLLPKEAPKAA